MALGVQKVSMKLTRCHVILSLSRADFIVIRSREFILHPKEICHIFFEVLVVGKFVYIRLEISSFAVSLGVKKPTVVMFLFFNPLRVCGVDVLIFMGDEIVSIDICLLNR